MLFRRMDRSFLLSEAKKNLKTKEELKTVEEKFKEEEKKQFDKNANIEDYDKEMKAQIQRLYENEDYVDARNKILV